MTGSAGPARAGRVTSSTPSHVGQAEVEDDQVGLARARLDDPARQRLGLEDTIALGFERRAHEAPDLAIVLDDQQLRNVFDGSDRARRAGAFTAFLYPAAQFVRGLYRELPSMAAL